MFLGGHSVTCHSLEDLKHHLESSSLHRGPLFSSKPQHRSHMEETDSMAFLAHPDPFSGVHTQFRKSHRRLLKHHPKRVWEEILRCPPAKPILQNQMYLAEISEPPLIPTATAGAPKSTQSVLFFQNTHTHTGCVYLLHTYITI